MLTLEQQIAASLARKNEVGTESPCPLCGRPRLRRSDYIRCTPCATNWLDGEDITKDPRIERMRKVVLSGQKQPNAAD